MAKKRLFLRPHAAWLVLVSSLVGACDDDERLPPYTDPPGLGGAGAPGGSPAGQGGKATGGKGGAGGAGGAAGKGGSGAPGAAGGAGGAGGPGGESGSSGQIEVGATSGELGLGFSVDLEGKGTGAVGAVSLKGAVGEAVIGGKAVPLVAYEQQAWPDFGYDLYQALGVEPGRWHVLWFYCSGPELTGVYRETTDGTAVIYEPASGSCKAGAPVVAEVTLPAVQMPVPALVDRFRVEGPGVEIVPGSPGWVDLSERMTVLPFNVVDCSKECGSPGWWELHSILWQPDKKRACFGIFYLFPGAESVQLTYALSLPDLGDPAGVVALEASWKQEK